MNRRWKGIICSIVCIIILCLAGTSFAARPPEWPVRSISYGGTLVLSDSPETVPDDGIMYRDTVQGSVRLYVYHVNGSRTGKKFAVVLENKGRQATRVKIQRSGIAGPWVDYTLVGKTALANYWQDDQPWELELGRSGKCELDPRLKYTHIVPGALLNGIYDIYSEQPVEVSVMMLPTWRDPLEYVSKAPLLPADEPHLRGTFAGRDRLVMPLKDYGPAKDQTVAITLADDEKDVFLKGWDAVDKVPAVNYGNYGVMYKIFLPSTGTGKFSCYLNPRGGIYAGWIGVDYRRSGMQWMMTPSDRPIFGYAANYDFAHLGEYEAGHPLQLMFSPPGASNLPIRLILTPIKDFY